MKKYLAIFLWIFLGYLVVSPVHAESIAATPSTSRLYKIGSQDDSTAVPWMEALNKLTSAGQPCAAGTAHTSFYGGRVYTASHAATGITGATLLNGSQTEPTGAVGSGYQTSCQTMISTTGAWAGWFSAPNSSLTVVGSYTCPPNQNWSLEGTFCTRPNCVAPQTRQADGTCQSPCEMKLGQTGTAQYAVGAGAVAAGGSYCQDGCQATLNSKTDPVASCSFTSSAGLCYEQVTYNYTITATACTAPNPASPDPIPAKKPPCDAAQGVLTSSTGTVACVPEGTPNTTKPVTEKTTTKQVNPDGTEVITEQTKTTDPKTGASSGSTSVTTPAGTTTTTSESTGKDTTGDGIGDGGGSGGDDVGDCTLEPDAPYCKDKCVAQPDLPFCKEMGTPDDEGPLNSVNRGVTSITPSNFASSASCPASINLPKGASLSFQFPCDLATGLRPILLALAWLSAGLIVMGAFRNG